MKTKLWLLIATFLTSFSLPYAFTQSNTTVKGKVLDAATLDALPYVSVQLEGTTLGARTDIEGNFFIEVSETGLSNIKVVCVGYTPQIMEITEGTLNQVTVFMQESTVGLQEITVRVKKYRNKGNPAVDLIKKMIENKDKNRKEGLDFYSYEKYEKVGFSLNNITDKTRKNIFFRNFQFVLENVDTNQVNGKVNLPMYLRETLSDVYYRKSPKSLKEYVQGERNVVFKDVFDLQGISYAVNNMYQEVNFYNNAVDLLTMQFISPLNPIAPAIYRFYIQDTVLLDNTPCAHIYYAPRNKTDLAFMGHIWVALDSTYAIRKIEAGIAKDINLNWVNEMQISQEFSWVGDSTGDQALMLTTDDIFIDFGLFRGDSTRSLLGHKITSYRKFETNKPLPDSLFKGNLRVVQAKESFFKDSTFWSGKRHIPLSKTDIGLKKVIDSLDRNRGFLRIVGFVRFLFEGYSPIGPIEIGPANAFYSFNPIEGFRMRLGGRTNSSFSNKLLLEWYGAYGFRDQKWKGFAGATYALGDAKIRAYPLHQVRAWYHNEIRIPGQDLQFVQEDNFFLSFKRGTNDRMYYNRNIGGEYLKEFNNGFTYALSAKTQRILGAGSLLFDYSDNGETRYKAEIRTSEVGVSLRFAPNEKFYQGATYRAPVLTKHPVFQFWYNIGVKNALHSELSYHSLRFRVKKALFLSPIGWSIATLEAGRTIGQVPYPILYAPNANQTYAYQLQSYNLMNFLEFVSDKHISLIYFHNFGGVFFGRIPLLKKMKLREVLTIKALWGGVDSRNRPDGQNKLLNFPSDANGAPTTFTLEQKPYVEASIGVANIFKILRIDVIRRFTYLDHPNVAEYGVRFRLKPEF